MSKKKITKTLKYKILKILAYTNKLTSYQKIASRVGYMGSGFLIAAQWTIEPYLYVIGFCFVIVLELLLKLHITLN